MKQVFFWQPYLVRRQDKIGQAIWSDVVLRAKFSDIFDAVLTRDWSYIIAIVGPPRVGKSTLATWIWLKFYEYKMNWFRERNKRHEIIERFFDKTADFKWKKDFMESRIVYEIKDNSLLFHGQKECFVLNEAILNVYKRRSSSKVNVAFIKFLTILQRHNNLIILVIPFFEQLDRELRRNFVDMIIRVKGRGFAEVFIKLERFIGLRKITKWVKVGNIVFDKLPSDIESMANAIDIAYKYKVASEIIESLGEKKR